jgi:murein L,D-transpeptidase YcbB/YkuD
VHTTYFTASADADGKVTTFADVYGLDKKVAPVVGRTPPESQQDIEEVAEQKPEAEASARNARKKETTGSIEGLFDTAR